MKIFIFSRNLISWIILIFKLSEKHNARMNLNTFITYALFTDIFEEGALLHTLYHPEKVENAPLKRAPALARKEVAKVSTPRENPRGDLIPPFSEIANLVLGRHRDKRAGGREHLFIGRVIGPRARRVVTTEFYRCTYFVRKPVDTSPEPSTLRPLEGTRREHGGRKQLELL